MWICQCVKVYHSRSASLGDAPNKGIKDLLYIKIFTANPSVHHSQPYMPNPILWGDDILENLWGDDILETSPGGRNGLEFLEASSFSFSRSHSLSRLSRTSTSWRRARKLRWSESARSLSVRLALATYGNEMPGMWVTECP